MFPILLSFANLFLVALLVGGMFIIWLGLGSSGLSAAAFVEVQQQLIRALNVAMPVLGAVSILLTAGSAFLHREQTIVLRLLVAATVCLILSGLITRFGNQPINATVMKWSPAEVPSNWAELRDRWQHWHVIRTLSGLAGLALVIAAYLAKVAR